MSHLGSNFPSTVDGSSWSHSLQQNSVSLWLYSIIYQTCALPGNSDAAGSRGTQEVALCQNVVAYLFTGLLNLIFTVMSAEANYASHNM